MMARMVEGEGGGIHFSKERDFRRPMSTIRKKGGDRLLEVAWGEKIFY